MSIRAIAAVFSADLPPRIKLLMLALGDAADDYGQSVYPSVASICQMTGYSRRQVQRLLRDAQARGVLEAVGIRRAGKSYAGNMEYRIQLGTLTATRAPRPAGEKACPRALRREVIEAFGRRCAYCGEPGDAERGPDGARWHVDRIVPDVRGGRYEPGNVTLACARCNRSKRDPAPPASLAERLGATGGRHDGTPSDGTPGRHPESPWGAISSPGGAPKMAPDPSVDPSVPKHPGFDGRPYADAFRTVYPDGKVPGALFRLAKPLEARHGRDRVVAELLAYLHATPREYLNLQKWAATFGTWANGTDRRRADRPTAVTQGKDFDA